MRPLKDALLPAVDNVVYVFYDFETTQNTEYTDRVKLHVPNLVCVLRFFFRYEDVEDGVCVLCVERKHSFWVDTFGALLSYIWEPCT